MTAHGDAAAPASAFWAWLRSELAARPGRGAAVARMTVNCTVTVIVGMVFQIPLPPTWRTSSSDQSGRFRRNARHGRRGALAATVAVVFTLLLFTIDAAEPGLRLPLMAASTFAGFFLARTSKVAPIAFLVGFVLVVTQTLVDVAPSTEALTRLVLWLWVVCIFPAALTALTDLAMGRQPAGLADETTLRLLDSITAVLRGAGQDDIAQRRRRLPRCSNSGSTRRWPITSCGRWRRSTGRLPHRWPRSLHCCPCCRQCCRRPCARCWLIAACAAAVPACQGKRRRRHLAMTCC